MATLEWIDFVPKLFAWVRLLFASLFPRLRVNNIIADTYEIRRGTRKGCPLSPLLFTIAIETLAAMIRADTTVKGCRLNDLEEKTSLYADDMLLYLADARGSLSQALHII